MKLEWCSSEILSPFKNLIQENALDILFHRITAIYPEASLVVENFINTEYSRFPWWSKDLEIISTLLALCDGNPLIHSVFLTKSQQCKAYIYILAEQPDKQRVQLPVIWDNMMPMWYHYNVWASNSPSLWVWGLSDSPFHTCHLLICLQSSLIHQKIIHIDKAFNSEITIDHLVNLSSMTRQKTGIHPCPQCLIQRVSIRILVNLPCTTRQNTGIHPCPQFLTQTVSITIKPMLYLECRSWQYPKIMIISDLFLIYHQTI